MHQTNPISPWIENRAHEDYKHRRGWIDNDFRTRWALAYAKFTGQKCRLPVDSTAVQKAEDNEPNAFCETKPSREQALSNINLGTTF